DASRLPRHRRRRPDDERRDGTEGEGQPEARRREDARTERLPDGRARDPSRDRPGCDADAQTRDRAAEADERALAEAWPRSLGARRTGPREPAPRAFELVSDSSGREERERDEERNALATHEDETPPGDRDRSVRLEQLLPGIGYRPGRRLGGEPR